MADRVSGGAQLCQEAGALFRRSVGNDVVARCLAQNGEQGAVKRPGTGEQGLECIGTAAAHQRIGILAFREGHDPQGAVGFEQRQRGGDSACGRARARGVSIEAQGRRGRLAPKLAELVLGEGCPERRDCSA